MLARHQVVFGIKLELPHVDRRPDVKRGICDPCDADDDPDSQKLTQDRRFLGRDRRNGAGQKAEQELIANGCDDAAKRQDNERCQPGGQPRRSPQCKLSCVLKGHRVDVDNQQQGHAELAFSGTGPAIAPEVFDGATGPQVSARSDVTVFKRNLPFGAGTISADQCLAASSLMADPRDPVGRLHAAFVRVDDLEFIIAIQRVGGDVWHRLRILDRHFVSRCAFDSRDARSATSRLAAFLAFPDWRGGCAACQKMQCQQDQ